MPLVDYLVDRNQLKNIDSAVAEFKKVLESMSTVIPEAKQTMQNYKELAENSNAKFNSLNDFIVASIEKILESMQHLEGNLRYSLKNMNQFIALAIIALKVIIVLLIIVTITYVYTNCCNRNLKPKRHTE